MKKITIFILFCAVTVSLSAQRISNLTVTGIPACVPFAAFNPTNLSETVLGDAQMIYPDGTDFSNVNVTLNVGTDSYVEAPNPLPTDWSSTVTGIKVTKTDNSAWAKYNVTLKKIKPAALPLEIKTGTGLFNSDSWTTSTTGWAGVCIDKAQTLIRLGSVNRSFMVAFNNAPDSLYYTIKYLTTSFPTDNTVIFDVDGSVDGINWTSINQYNGSNTMPLSTPAVIAKLKISSQYRFVRWVYSKRASTNISIENIKVTKDTSTLVENPWINKVKLYFVSNNSLSLENANDVSSLNIYNTTGLLVFETKNPGSLIQMKNVPYGVYVGLITMKDGSIITRKISK